VKEAISRYFLLLLAIFMESNLDIEYTHCLFIGMALASINGLMASTFLLPYFGYGPIFVMFGMLNVLSLFLLSVFDENKLTR
jgi:hypothetical protein